MNEQRPRRALIALAVLVAGLLAACGIPTDSEPRPLAETTTTAVAADSRGRTAATIYLWSLAAAQDDVVVGGQLAEVQRRLEVVTPQTVLDEVLAGPTQEDSAAELTTNIPPTTAGTVEVDGDLAEVAMNAVWDELRVPDLLGACAQVVYTLTEISGISRVAFTVEGQPFLAPTVSNARLAVVTRDDYEELAPT